MDRLRGWGAIGCTGAVTGSLAKEDIRGQARVAPPSFICHTLTLTAQLSWQIFLDNVHSSLAVNLLTWPVWSNTVKIQMNAISWIKK